MMVFKRLFIAVSLLLFYSCTAPEDTLVGWGDSMMKGSLSKISILEVIQEELGLATINFGQGGLRSSQVAILQGGAPFYVSPIDRKEADMGMLFLPPKDAPFTSFGTQQYTGNINGIGGSLKRVADTHHPNKTAHLAFSGDLTDTLMSSNALLFDFDHAQKYRKSPTIIWAGRNDQKSDAGRIVILENLKMMVAHLEGDAKQNYLILGICNGRSDVEANDTPAYQNILALNTSLASHFGSHYVDVRAVMMKDAFSLLDIVPTSQDKAAIRLGCIPERFFADEVHFNELGNKALGLYLAQRILEKGWTN